MQATESSYEIGRCEMSLSSEDPEFYVHGAFCGLALLDYFTSTTGEIRSL